MKIWQWSDFFMIFFMNPYFSSSFQILKNRYWKWMVDIMQFKRFLHTYSLHWWWSYLYLLGLGIVHLHLKLWHRKISEISLVHTNIFSENTLFEIDFIWLEIIFLIPSDWIDKYLLISTLSLLCSKMSELKNQRGQITYLKSFYSLVSWLLLNDE